LKIGCPSTQTSITAFKDAAKKFDLLGDPGSAAPEEANGEDEDVQPVEDIPSHQRPEELPPLTPSMTASATLNP